MEKPKKLLGQPNSMPTCEINRLKKIQSPEKGFRGSFCVSTLHGVLIFASCSSGLCTLHKYWAIDKQRKLYMWAQSHSDALQKWTDWTHSGVNNQIDTDMPPQILVCCVTGLHQNLAEEVTVPGSTFSLKGPRCENHQFILRREISAADLISSSLSQTASHRKENPHRNIWQIANTMTLQERS